MNLINPESRDLLIEPSFSEDFVILAYVVLIQCQRVTDGQTDRHTDDRLANKRLCIASYADAV